MKIISWNVNGLRAAHKKGLFLPFIEKYKPDILCLQEIKSKKDQNELDLKEYEEIWNPAEKAGYAGVAIFSKQKPLNVVFGFPEEILEKYKLEEDKYGDPNNEGRVLTAEFNDFFVVNVYTPNAKPDLTRLNLRHKKWDPAFLEYVVSLKKKKPVIFCGDLNVAHMPIDLAHPKENEEKKGFTKEERTGIDNIVSAGFVDTFRHFNKEPNQYTWWSHFANSRARNVGWRIDYVFVSARLMPKVKSAFIRPEILGSDHCPVGIELDIV